MARPGTWSGLAAQAFPRTAWDPHSQEPTAPCGSGLQPAAEGPVGLVTLILSFRMAAAAGVVTHTHAHVCSKSLHQLGDKGFGMCWEGQALLLPSHPLLATDLQNPALRTSQVPHMDRGTQLGPCKPISHLPHCHPSGRAGPGV